MIIKICGCGEVNFTFTESYKWGDLFMAGNIKKKLYDLYGLNCQICLINDWYNYDIYNCNNILFLRGISIYKPKLENNNTVLFISHPESYTDEEFKKYNKIICCSRIYYEKIKTNLKLNEDNIIFTLQPIHVNVPEKYEINRELIYDAIFVGNKIRERTSISWLTKENLDKVKIYGNNWDSKNYMPILNNIKPLENSNLIEKYELSKIVLNDTWLDMSKNGFINDRVLTALIFSHNVLTDNVYGLNDFDFENIFIYENKTELNNLFDKLLKSPKNIKSSKNKNIILNNNNKLYNFIYKLKQKPIHMDYKTYNFDSKLYCYLNNFNGDVTSSLYNYLSYDFMKGKIMSFEQIKRIYPNVKRLDSFNLSFNNIKYDIKLFIDNYITNKDKNHLLFNHNIELIHKNIKVDKYNLGIFIQISNLININYIIEVIKNLLLIGNNKYLIFISLTNNISDEFMKSNYTFFRNISNVLIIKTNNYGFDIPNFMIQLNYISKLNIEINYIFKIHSKTDTFLIKKLTNNIEKIDKILNYLNHYNIMYFSFDEFSYSYNDFCKNKNCDNILCNNNRLYYNNYYRIKYDYNDYIFLSHSIGIMKTKLVKEKLYSIDPKDINLLLTNNFFYKNHIFYINSFVHFLERYLLGNNKNIKFVSYNELS